MDSGELISEGVNLMLLGMGAVFVFLTLLVMVTTLMSSIILKYTLAPVHSQTEAQIPQYPKANDELSQQTLISVISAAINAHRSKK
jgi:oxaloacetate decarboxylase (Na+ extruding) subunit gamma